MQNFVSQTSIFTHGLKQFFSTISPRKEYKLQENRPRQERVVLPSVEEGNCTGEKETFSPVVKCYSSTFSLGFLFSIAFYSPFHFAQVSPPFVLYETIPREPADYLIRKNLTRKNTMYTSAKHVCNIKL